MGPWGGDWGGRLNTPEDFANAWREGVRDLGRLQRELEGQPEMGSKDIQK